MVSDNTTTDETRETASSQADSSAGGLTELARQQLNTRRGVLTKAAVGSAGLLAFTGGTNATTAISQDDSGSDGDGGDGPSNVDVLNYALTLEHLENAFYREGLERFSDEELRTAEVVCARNGALAEGVPERIKAVRDHEAAHVDTITQVIKDLGGEPVEEACYDFGYETPSEFLQVGMALENTGVSAYDGAIHFFDNDKLATAGATIATVEARHASYLNTLNNENPFPNAFDEAKSMEQVKEIAGQFIVEC